MTMKGLTSKGLLKNYRWRVDPNLGLVITPRKQVTGKIGLGPSAAKAVNREICEMSGIEFEDFLSDFNPRDQDRLRKLRAIVTEMKV